MKGDSNGFSVHSPASGLTDGFGVGGLGGAGSLTVHPDINVSGASGASAQGNSFGDAKERTPVSVDEVQVADGLPESYNDGALGETLVGGLGNPPRP